MDIQCCYASDFRDGAPGGAIIEMFPGGSPQTKMESEVNVHFRVHVCMYVV